jgi:predicted nuclease with RNAse H fold
MSRRRRILGIDLGGAASPTTGYALLGGAGVPELVAAGRPLKSANPADAEERLLALIDDWQPDVVAIDAPLTLPPCLSCPSYCRGPGELCELGSARWMWDQGRNPVAQRPCEVVLEGLVQGIRPIPTMQLGVITARAVVLARRLANRGSVPSVLERGEILEVYPRATLTQLQVGDNELRPRDKGEAPDAYRARVRSRLRTRIGQLDEHASELRNGHVFDALIAAYTGWLGPKGLQQPPDGFNLSSGWIWFPKTTALDAAAP